MKRLFGSINRKFLTHSYIISGSVTFLMLILFTQFSIFEHDEPLKVNILLILTGLLYPFTRYAYFSIKYPTKDFYHDLVPFEKEEYSNREIAFRLFIKFLAFLMLYSLTVLIAPIAIIYLLVTNRK